MTMDLYLGTSSWTAPAWTGVFYPPGTPTSRYLSYYSRQFGTVEIDATFYATPAPSTVDGWRQRTPEGFVFAAKAPKAITHDKALVDCEGDVAHFTEVMERLGDRLGPILFQFKYYKQSE